MIRPRLGPLLAVLLTFLSAGHSVGEEAATIRSKPITNFKLGSGETVFGKAEFLGGIDMSSSNPLFGAFSSIRFRPDGSHFLGVLDTGHWIEGRVTRDDAGKLSGVADVRITSMRDSSGRTEDVKYRMDSEGLALRDGQALVSFERFARVDVYPDPGFATARPLRSLPILIAPGRLRSNRGLETVAVSPESSPLKGAPVIVAELSFDQQDHLLAAILEGPRRGPFSVVQHDPFAVTDGAFLPNGDLLLLERRFSFAAGLGMQVRRIDGDSIKPGAVVDGEIILSADLGYQIDNMEGLDVVMQPNEDTRLVIVSDDNHSILQRNLMLEFRLLPQ
ncbi:esterase-like activity of phytase family protein [Rhizobium sp. YIM 134829]|uniref:esterase-like activity of phytase family protein n=1 Tax=Rhizobium sp. YIM 134829 TaxID=3390453 RepID=UPI00397AFCCD